jgi:hypothetical protein
MMTKKIGGGNNQTMATIEVSRRCAITPSGTDYCEGPRMEMKSVC